MYWTHWANCAKTPGPCICPMYRKWPDEDEEMEPATMICDGCGESAWGEHRCKDLKCLTCAGYAHMPGKCLHPGCACETETW